ncbi:mu-type opioid receptor-like [Actinia tenebrosa]|uniref:Mu-type opioid receptor-like n=1 Tax=Actinia tenebrosa TaxID=6105 RepID=A0A6P8HTU8_ACTTE|nr:mu-type opioid receptor-like [Actinia tenebrosa]
MNISQFYKNISDAVSLTSRNGMKNESFLAPYTKTGSRGVFDVIIGVIFIILCLTGIMGNSLTFRVIWKTETLHSTTNFLFANLALSDFLTLVFGIPNAVALEVGNHPEGLLGTWLCKFVTAGNEIGIMSTSSVLTLCLLAVERYNAIVKPMATNRRLTTSNTKYALTLIWILATILNIPLFVRSAFNDKKGFCDYGWSLKQELTYIFVLGFLLVVIPSVIIIFCYVAIIKEMYFSNSVNPNPTTQDEDARSRRKILIILLVVTTLFLVCFGAFSITWPLKISGVASQSAYNLSVQCLFVQSCINPIIYAFQSTNYRRALINLLKCCRDVPEFEQRSSNNIRMAETSLPQNL